MRRTTLGIVTALTLMTTVAAHSACIDDVTSLSSELETLQSESTEALPSAEAATTVTTESTAASAPAGEALTGDPLNPKPGSPSTAEQATSTPTSEEGEGVMPGADASVDLVGEELSEVAALIEQAREASTSGDENACAEAIVSAQDIMSRLSAAN
ncbi:hypothetical protein [Devosia naphthalenivorans]|uniref:hypothetical protein n=1 Tax=Devosia naphthalenivorans TaxID=2082392 RepID=UPI000D3D9DC6|nr:hypothetical protein [Devosia naphthalenivorans]